MSRRFPIYERLLRLYPKEYREAYGDQMLQTLQDMIDDQPNLMGRAHIWTRVAVELPINVINQNTLAIGDNLMHQTPSYIKRNGIIASTLLVPFVVALIANGVDKIIYGHTLYNSWAWSVPILITWVAVLPALAFILALASYLLFVATDKTQKSLFKKLTDIRHTWPVLLTGLFGLGIIFLLLFHDSAHCWVQNPLHTVTNLRQTWRCTTSGFLGGK